MSDIGTAGAPGRAPREDFRTPLKRARGLGSGKTGTGHWWWQRVTAVLLVLLVPWLVGLYITAAYWFTSSTSFANPAVAIARSLTNTFSGIRPADLPGFIAAELGGAVAALLLMNWLLRGGGGAAAIKEARS